MAQAVEREAASWEIAGQPPEALRRAPPGAAPPDHVGRYRIRAQVGAGAFGTVYRAHDPQLDREVAVKVLQADLLGDAQAVARFLREAKAAARLNHPHIVPVYDAGQDGDTYFIASAYIAGTSLAAAIPPGGLEPARAARLAYQLADALAFAHAKGVLHRDVKPGNCLLEGGEQLYLTDFGLAGWWGPAGSRMTRAGEMLGTPAFMAPEQALGDQAQVGPAADQYSAGVVLYQLLTGQLPYNGAPAQVLAQLLNQAPPPPSRHRPDLDPKLEAICLQAMARRPLDRFPGCQAFAHALRDWLFHAGTPQQALAPPRNVPWKADPPPPPEEDAAAEAPGTARPHDTARPPKAAPGRPFPEPPQAPIPWGVLVALLILLGALTLAFGTRKRPRPVATDPLAERRHDESPRPRSPEDAEPPYRLPVQLGPAFVNSVGMKLVPLPAGHFVMGSPPDEEGRQEDEAPHRVTLTRPFYLGVHEVTQAQYEQVMGTNPAYFKGPDRPVEMVSWHDAVEFCRRLAERPEERVAGRRYRLPTEAEWEYACRAGSTVATAFGADLSADQANFNGAEPYGEAPAGPYRRGTAPVGSYRPNAWGLYDMHGNVEEWCADWRSPPEQPYYRQSPATDPQGPPTGTNKVVRGGSWNDPGWSCRSAAHIGVTPEGRYNFFGFRVACDVGPAEPVAPVRPVGGRRGGGDAETPPAPVPPVRAPGTFTNGLGMALVPLPAGAFQMGTPETERDRNADEWLHPVTLPRPFALGAFEVTQAQYEALMGANPARFKGADRPVEGVTRADALEFCRRLTERPEEQQAGRIYRLPTEAEWEYACRAGTTTPFACGGVGRQLLAHAWYAENGENQTHPVGRKTPNAWGLYDLHGNVAEWCLDWYDEGTYRQAPAQDPQGPPIGARGVARGGAWKLYDRDCRSGHRGAYDPGERYDFIGFRVVCVQNRPLSPPPP